MLQKHLYTFILFLIGVACFGQTATILGTIKDDDGVSIPDVQIAILEDGSISTSSDANGKFSLIVPADKDITLSVYSLSYKQVNQKFKLKAGEQKTQTLLGIAYDCGFNSKATFNRAFKKSTGLSPKEWLEAVARVEGIL